MIWLFRASAIALALLWTNWRDLDAIGEIFMPVLVGLADEHLCFMSCVFVEVFSNTTDVVRLGTRWGPVGDPLGTRWEPVGDPYRAQVLPLAGGCWRDTCPAATW